MVWPFKKATKVNQRSAGPAPGLDKEAMFFFFQSYVLSVIGALPHEVSEQIKNLDLQSIFNIDDSDWRGAVRQVLHLSDTFEIAVKDLWYTNSHSFAEQGELCEPQEFARGFVINYLKEGSAIDVWPPGALEAAMVRIAEHETPGA